MKTHVSFHSLSLPFTPLILFFTFHLSPFTLNAQDVPSESVLVRGSYRPVIDTSEKIFFPTDITDTAAVSPHSFIYSITPTRLHALYEPARIRAARIKGEPATRLYNNYLRVGMGNYWSPLLDLYWSSTRDPLKTYGVRFNHQSSWGSISSDDPAENYGKNHFGFTGITLFGKYIVKDILQLSSDLSYEHDHNLLYGFNDNTLQTALGMNRDDVDLSDIRAKYNRLSWNFGLRNMELDANKLGYSLNLRLYDLWASWYRNDFNLNLSGDIHYGFNIGNQYKGVAYLRAEWDGYIQSFDADGAMPLGYVLALPVNYTEKHHLNIVKVNPYADFMLNGLHFHAGFTAGWDAYTELAEGTIFRFFPDVVVSKHLFDGTLVLSLGATGGIDANNLNTIRQLNPYIAPLAEYRATRHYDFTGHARWTLSKKLELNVEVGYSLLQDDLTFMLDPNYGLNNVFQTLYLDDNRFTVGGDIAFVNDEMLTLRVGGHYYSYANIEYDTPALLPDAVFYRPDWDLLAAMDLNYDDKWLFHLEGDLLGKTLADNGDELPIRYGINAEVEYRHNRALSFFLKMDNLAFQRYFYWANYPSQRGLFILGLTYTIN